MDGTSAGAGLRGGHCLFQGADEIGVVGGSDALAVILPHIVQIALLHDGLRRAELTGQAVTLGADVHHLVERALRRGLRAHSHLIGYRPVPSGIGAAGIRRPHAAVRADTDRCQAAAGTVEGLVRQIRMDLLHHLSPQGGRGVHGVAEPLVVLVAHPDRRAVIRRVACEITVIVVVGGAGFSCNVHPAESSAAAGAAGLIHRPAQHVRHQIGGGLLHGHPLLRLLFQHHGGVVVGQNLYVGLGLIVHTAVGESSIGRRHLHRAEAVSQAAQPQRADVHILRCQTQPQIFGGELVGRRDPNLFQCLHRDGVDGCLDTVAHGCPARVGVGRVLGPWIPIQQADRVVVKGGCRRDCPRIQRRGISRQRLDGGTRLLDIRCIVPQQVSGLGSHIAHHGHDVAGGGLDNGNAGVDQLSAGRGEVVQTPPVLVDRLRNLLNLRVQRGVDVVAAVVDPVQGLFFGDAVQVRQIRGDIPQHLVHEPGVDIGAAGSLRDNVLSGSGAVREMQLLRLGGLGLLLCQIGEPGDAHIVIAAGHPGQDHLLALLVQLPGRDGAAVLPGDGDGGHRTIQGGVVGDGDEAGAFRRIQLRHILAEVELRRGLDAVAALSQIDGVQVHLQDLLLGVVLLELQGPENLPHLAVDGVAVVAGHVLQHLLRQGGAAEGGPAAGEEVQRGGGGSGPVHAVVLKESVVLNGYGRLPQRVRDLFIVHPDAVFRAVDSLVFHPISGVPVLVIDDGAEIHGVVVGVDLQRRGQRGPDVHHKKPGKHRHCADAHQQDRPQDEDDLVSRSFGAFLLSGFPAGDHLMGSLPSSAFQCRAPPSFEFEFSAKAVCRAACLRPQRLRVLHNMFYCTIPCQYRKCRILPKKSFLSAWFFCFWAG